MALHVSCLGTMSIMPMNMPTCVIFSLYIIFLRHLNTILIVINFSRRSIHQSEKRDTDFYHSPSVFVYVVHLAFMTFFGFTSMHVQVSVSLLSVKSYFTMKRSVNNLIS